MLDSPRNSPHNSTRFNTAQFNSTPILRSQSTPLPKVNTDMEDMVGLDIEAPPSNRGTAHLFLSNLGITPESLQGMVSDLYETHNAAKKQINDFSGQVKKLTAIISAAQPSSAARSLRNVLVSEDPSTIKIKNVLMELADPSTVLDPSNAGGSAGQTAILTKLKKEIQDADPAKILQFMQSPEGKEFLDGLGVPKDHIDMITVSLGMQAAPGALNLNMTTGEYFTAALKVFGDGGRGMIARLIASIPAATLAEVVPDLTIRTFLIMLPDIATKLWTAVDQLHRELASGQNTVPRATRIMQVASGLLSGIVPIILTGLVKGGVIPDNEFTRAAISAYGVGSLTTLITEFLKDRTQSSVTAPIKLVKMVNGEAQPLDKDEKQIINVINDILYTAACLVFLGCGPGLGAAIAAQFGLTGVAAGAATVVSKVAADNVSPAFAEFFRNVSPSISKAIYNLFSHEDLKIVPGTQENPGLGNFEDFKTYASGRLTPRSIVDTFIMFANLAQGMNAPAWVSVALKTLADLVWGLIDNHKWFKTLTDAPNAQDTLLSLTTQYSRKAIGGGLSTLASWANGANTEETNGHNDPEASNASKADDASHAKPEQPEELAKQEKLEKHKETKADADSEEVVSLI